MRILHTSDWHLGQKLYGRERYKEFDLFLNHLLLVIQQQSIDVLLVSGDIFDVPHPSNHASKLYYRFLSKLSSTCCKKTIITSGNHDSTATIDAPKELLDAMDVVVIGSVPTDLNELIIEIDGDEKLQIAAIPYLRERDITKSSAGESNLEKEHKVVEGIVNFYQSAATFLKPNIPSIAMGHLFAIGSSVSDSERDIHVGNLGAIAASQFPQEFDYVALGHIHRPQIIGNNEFIRYSGSPIPLSFSERNDTKSMVVLNLENNKIEIDKILNIPTYRHLLRVTGKLDDVITELKNYSTENMLTTWCEVEIKEQKYTPEITTRFEAFLEAEKLDLEIVKFRYVFENQNNDVPEHFLTQHLEDFSALEVFEMKVENMEDKTEYIETFSELLNIYEETQRENN